MNDPNCSNFFYSRQQNTYKGLGMELDGKVNERKQGGWKWNFTMHIIQFNFIINIQSVLLPQKINIHAQKMEVNLEGKSGGWKKKCCSFLHIFFQFYYCCCICKYIPCSFSLIHSLCFVTVLLLYDGNKTFFFILCLTSSTMLNVNWQYVHGERRYFHFLGQCLRATIFFPSIHSFFFFLSFETDIIMKITM